jgi:hypothetical protein
MLLQGTGCIDAATFLAVHRSDPNQLVQCVICSVKLPFDRLIDHSLQVHGHLIELCSLKYGCSYRRLGSICSHALLRRLGSLFNTFRGRHSLAFLARADTHLPLWVGIPISPASGHVLAHLPNEPGLS